MKKSVKIASIILCAVLLACSMTFFVSADNAIGYKLIARKNGNTMTAEIYVTDGVALAGQLGLSFDPAKVTLVNSDGSAISTPVITDIVKSAITENEDTAVVITHETNTDTSLVGTDAVYFAWFANYTAVVDATSAPVKIAEIKFTVNDGATGLETALSFKKSAPDASTGIVGYKSGLFVCALENGKSVSHYADRTPLLSYEEVYAENNEFVVTDGKIVEYNGEGGDVTLPGNATSVGTGVFDEATVSALIPTAITEIEEGAFAAGTKLYVSPKVSVTLIAAWKALGYETIYYGDVNSDGKVDAADFSLMMRSMAGDGTASMTDDAKVTDIKFDGKFGLKDLSHFAKYFAGAAIDIGYQG